jgi:hypothetical protein
MCGRSRQWGKPNKLLCGSRYLSIEKIHNKCCLNCPVVSEYGLPDSVGWIGYKGR